MSLYVFEVYTAPNHTISNLYQNHGLNDKEVTVRLNISLLIALNYHELLDKKYSLT